jgi:hypothetical protein
MRTHIEIKRIDLWSLFKIAFLLYFAFGLIAGLFYGFFILLAGAFQDVLGEEFASFGILGGLLGLLLIPVIAVMYGAIGSVFLTVGGFAFNLVAGAVGGLRLETQVDLAEQQPTITPPAVDPGRMARGEPEEEGPTIG